MVLQLKALLKKKFPNNNISYVEINEKLFKVPEIILNKKVSKISNMDVNNALTFNKNVIYEHFIIPNKLKFPLSRNILQKYFV